jgi:hypothetical protein
VHRSAIADTIPAGLPPAVADAARDALGGAVAVDGATLTPPTPCAAR